MVTCCVRILGRVVLLAALAAQLDAGIIAARGRETLEELESRATREPLDYTTWNRIAEARLRLLATTGDLVNLTLATKAVDQSLKAAAPESNPAGLALRVRVELGSHRFQQARSSAEKLCSLQPQNADALALLGDAYFNLGDYTQCEKAWGEMIVLNNSTLTVEPRLAQLDLVYGRIPIAETRYRKVLDAAGELRREAPDVLAWANVQLGQLAFANGDWDAAGKDYEAALSAQPGYYSALEHKAELLGAQGDLDASVALYTKLIERSPRPEVMHALGDLYQFFEKPAAAVPWHAKALAAYLESAQRGEPIYFHNLASLYGDSLNEPDHALEWARRDLANRHSINAYDSMAWALYQTGSVDDARDTIAHSLALETRDAHILYHAGMILLKAGDILAGRLRLQETVLVNPRYHTFHVHRG